MVVNGVEEFVSFTVELLVTPVSRGFDERDSASGAGKSPLLVGLFATGGFSRIYLGDSGYGFFALMGAPLEKLMGKRLRPGWGFFAAGLFAALVCSLFMGLH